MTELTCEDLELARWCAFTITKGFQADRDGTLAAGKLVEKIDAALRSRPAVVDAEVVALVERLDELHAKTTRGLWNMEWAGDDNSRFACGALNAWPTLSAALRSWRTK